MSNRMVKLAQRPTGMVKRENFSIEDGPVPQPGPASSASGSNTSRSIRPCADG